MDLPEWARHEPQVAAYLEQDRQGQWDGYRAAMLVGIAQHMGTTGPELDPVLAEARKEIDKARRGGRKKAQQWRDAFGDRSLDWCEAAWFLLVAARALHDGQSDGVRLALAHARALDALTIDEIEAAEDLETAAASAEGLVLTALERARAGASRAADAGEVHLLRSRASTVAMLSVDVEPGGDPVPAVEKMMADLRERGLWYSVSEGAQAFVGAHLSVSSLRGAQLSAERAEEDARRVFPQPRSRSLDRMHVHLATAEALSGDVAGARSRVALASELSPGWADDIRHGVVSTLMRLVDSFDHEAHLSEARLLRSLGALAPWRGLLDAPGRRDSVMELAAELLEPMRAVDHPLAPVFQSVGRLDASAGRLGPALEAIRLAELVAGPDQANALSYLHDRAVLLRRAGDLDAAYRCLIELEQRAIDVGAPYWVLVGGGHERASAAAELGLDDVGLALYIRSMGWHETREQPWDAAECEANIAALTGGTEPDGFSPFLSGGLEMAWGQPCVLQVGL